MDTRYIEKMSNSLQAMIKVTDDINTRIANLEATVRGIEIATSHFEAKVERNEKLMQAILRKEGMGIQSDEDLLLSKTSEMYTGEELDDKIGQADNSADN